MIPRKNLPLAPILPPPPKSLFGSENRSGCVYEFLVREGWRFDQKFCRNVVFLSFTNALHLYRTRANSSVTMH